MLECILRDSCGSEWEPIRPSGCLDEIDWGVEGVVGEIASEVVTGIGVLGYGVEVLCLDTKQPWSNED